jgi:general secretion pathway protein H
MTLHSKSAPRTGRDKEAGFTLLEMLVVIAIMGVALLLITGYGRPHSEAMEMQAGARAVAASMRAARGDAIDQGHPVAFTLPRLPASITATIQAPAGCIVFAPDGSASGGRVVLDGPGQELAISADWLTGQVQINAQ